MRAFVVPPGLPEPASDDPGGSELRALRLGGIYFFLYPFILEIQCETGQLIDPQSTACFETGSLQAVARHLDAARKKAEITSEVFQQHVGRGLPPAPREILEPVRRSDLLNTIDTLVSLAHRARSEGSRLFLVGE